MDGGDDPSIPDDDPSNASGSASTAPPAGTPIDPTPAMTRRRFLLQGAVMAGAGAVVGAAAVVALSEFTAPTRTRPVRSPVPELSARTSPGVTTPAGSPPVVTTSSGTSPGPAAGTPAAASGAVPGSVPGGILPTPAGASLEPIEPPPARGPGRVSRENLRRGTDAWELPLRGKGNAEAYVSDVSVVEGDRLEVRVSSSQPRATITVYRLGWYGGRGARVVARWRDLPILAQPAATTDPVTGLIRASWTAAVATSVPEGWVSGIYLGVVAPVGGAPQYCTFVVREARPAAGILFLSAATTHQAYNAWGGKSLYPDESTGAPTISGAPNAVIAGWDRPYAENRGAGLVLRWEYPFVRWMESRGYDVEYAADMDLERHPELVTGRRLLVFAGHPEYWSVDMRRTVEGAIAAGTNIAFFAANEMYWRVRFDQVAGGPYRTVTCYRRADLDPQAVSDPVHATTKWRDLPAKNPESLLLGQMYGHVVLTPADFVCSAPDHWIYEGTGLRAGDAIANLVGQEYDRFWPDPALSPPGTQVLAVSPVNPNLGHDVGVYGAGTPDEPQLPVHNATIYTAASGATVFSAGTLQWSWALDDWGSPEFEGIRTPLDPRVARITANILDRLGR